ncbi:26S proteasome regulatory subunit 10B [Trichonephila clavipes]|uniref:26S proteasome regulatory subunit 10B n=1 Tax=Trichonephila clavipes TaxID=2585209 RepID=A0A8X6T6K3_TRICX|nr:26S proteasome regulatory subunit 10B [Trichonephila clavipes]
MVGKWSLCVCLRKPDEDVDTTLLFPNSVTQGWTREGTHAWKTASGVTRREDRRIVRQALVDPSVTRSTLRADVGVAIVPQTISRRLAEANLKSSSALPCIPFNIGNCVYSGAKPDQRGMSQFGKRLCLVMNPGLFWGQMITVYGCGGALQELLNTSYAIFRLFHGQPATPICPPVDHVWDQLKRQMPSCHSVHDLELADQDLWAHLPQDNIRCLINSMPDRVATFIAAGGGRRFSEGTSADREIQRTLMELLNQMDGFDSLGQVKIIMATNRPDTLDPALLRPGRLDRKIEIPLPNEQARLEICKIHAAPITKHGEIDWEAVVKLSDGFNGADLRNVCTEAGMFAIRADREYVVEEDFMKAVRKVADNKKLESKLDYKPV